MNSNSLSYLGLATRAGKLVTGDESVIKAIRSGQAKLVIVAQDASHNAKKKYDDKCEHYGVPIRECFTRAELGASIGKPERVVLAITEAGFAELFRRSLEKLAEVKGIEQKGNEGKN